MARREYFSRFQCQHPGCTEFAHFVANTRAEQNETLKRNSGKWRCVRHTHEDEVLSAENPKRITEQAVRQEDYGRYWGSSGFVYGPGFKAFAKDFPPGTILRVTAEVILPRPAKENEGHG